MSYPFTNKVSTNKKSQWINRCIGIVIHHTAWGTYMWNVNYLSKNPAQASVHFVIWPDWEVAKIWDPRDILWHAGNGSWGWFENVNTGFLWIEVVGYWEYNIQQLIRLTDLVEYLMFVYQIDRDNIVRHSDVTQPRVITRERKYWDGKQKVKKLDIGVQFFGNDARTGHDTFQKWRGQLIPRPVSRYGDLDTTQ